MISVSEILVKIWLKSVLQILRFIGWIKKKEETTVKQKDPALARILIILHVMKSEDTETWNNLLLCDKFQFLIFLF